jgi:HEPN domain-containing protein
LIDNRLMLLREPKGFVMDFEKHVVYWSSSALEDIEAAEVLLDAKRARHGLFFAHLALEKILKAHFCRESKDIAPKIHNLLALSLKIQLKMPSEQREFLARFDRYQIEGRYPASLPAPVRIEIAREEMRLAKEVLEWLKARL